MPHPRFQLAPLALAAVLALTTLAIAAPSAHAQAAAVAVPISLPAQPLGTALNELARQAKLQLMVHPDLLAGKQAPAVSGTLTPRQALDRLLAGSGLVAEINGAEVIVRRAPASPSASAETTLSSVTVTAQAVRGSLTEGTNSYASSEVSLAKGQSLREIPQSVSVLTQQRMQDEAITTLQEALAHTTGVVTTRDYYNDPNTFYSRGFQMNHVQVDGASLGAYSDRFYSHNMAMYDHVEVLRGADGLYSGVGEPGGTINLVRKRPTRTPQLSFTAEAGSWDAYRGEVDASGPLALDGRLRGRAVLSMTDKDSFQQVVSDKVQFLYGTLEADLGHSTQLQVGASYNKHDSGYWPFGLPRYGDGTVIPLDRGRTTAAKWSYWNRDSKEVFARLDTEFDNGWKLNGQYTHLQASGGSRGISHWGSATADGYVGVRTSEQEDRETRKDALDINLKGSFSAFQREHQFLLGANYQRQRDDTNSYSLIWDDANPGTDVMNIFTDDFYNYPEPSGQTLAAIYKGTTTQKALYGRLSLQLTDPLRLIAGARVTHFANSSSNFYTSNSTGSSSRYSDAAIWTPYVGFLYDFNSQWTGYGSFTRIHKSQADRLSASVENPYSTAKLDPIEGSNLEFGLKGEHMDGRLTSSFAIYRTTRRKEAISDPAFDDWDSDKKPGNCCYVENGDVLSRGVEMEVAGRILPNWQLSAGYTFNQNENRNTKARYSAVTPKHLFKFSTSYQPRDLLDGKLTVGGGATVQSRHTISSRIRWADPWTRSWAPGGNIPHQYSQGGYAVWDVYARVNLTKNWKLQLNINNLFDRHYFAYLSDVDRGNIYGTPRQYVLTLRGNF